ncbi:hypothetical protein HAX54_000467, partial [Datura stramonium]|nr:hypothetical protein [Datura stramonium]
DRCKGRTFAAARPLPRSNIRYNNQIGFSWVCHSEDMISITGPLQQKSDRLKGRREAECMFKTKFGDFHPIS